MCLITAVLDISFYIEDVVDGTGYFFSTSASVLYNMQSLVEILTSVSLFAGYVLGWHFYMRQGNDMAPGELENAEQPQFGRVFRAREPSHDTDQSKFRISLALDSAWGSRCLRKTLHTWFCLYAC